MFLSDGTVISIRFAGEIHWIFIIFITIIIIITIIG